MTTVANVADPVETARALAPLIREHADETEAGRRLAPALVRAFTETGLFRLTRPVALGGLGVDPITGCRVVEEIAQVDGSVGWCLMIALGSVEGLARSGDHELLKAAFGDDSDAVLGGGIFPPGRATPVEGGYRLSGRWSFGSGSEHCTWLSASCFVYDGDSPRENPDGTPQLHYTFFPAADCQILDTWTVLGLRGTGSHDYEVSDAFVPTERVWAFGGPPGNDAPIFRARFYLLHHAVHALGVARHAIEAFKDLAGAKSFRRSDKMLRDRLTVQMDVSRAEALVRSARAYVYAVAEDAWQYALAGDEISLEQMGELRLATVHAVRSAKEAVDLVYEAAGSTSIFTSSPLERCFRDIHVATQHAAVAPASYEITGRILLGLDPGNPFVF